MGDRVRVAGDVRSEIDDYTLVDVTLRRSNFLKHLDIALSAHNLFDENAREPSDGQIPDDYPLAGRSIWLELSWRI